MRASQFSPSACLLLLCACGEPDRQAAVAPASAPAATTSQASGMSSSGLGFVGAAALWAKLDSSLADQPADASPLDTLVTPEAAVAPETAAAGTNMRFANVPQHDQEGTMPVERAGDIAARNPRAARR